MIAVPQRMRLRRFKYLYIVILWYFDIDVIFEKISKEKSYDDKILNQQNVAI